MCKSMKKEDFIKLKAIFCEELHNAIVKEDLKEVELLFNQNYASEIEDHMVENKPLTQKDILEIKSSHLYTINNTDLSWAY